MNPLTTHILAAYAVFAGSLTATFAWGLEWLPFVIVSFLGIGIVYSEFKRVARNQELLEQHVRQGMERRARKGEVSVLTTDEFDE